MHFMPTYSKIILCQHGFNKKYSGESELEMDRYGDERERERESINIWIALIYGSALGEK
jgi:hypothetical protein